MDQTPDTPAADDAAPVESAPYGVGDRALAGVLLVGTALLAFVCLDVLLGGRLAGALTARPSEAEQ
jgi:hypothetical protein